jgi:hypothetical protein
MWAARSPKSEPGATRKTKQKQARSGARGVAPRRGAGVGDGNRGEETGAGGRAGGEARPATLQGRSGDKATEFGFPRREKE